MDHQDNYILMDDELQHEGVIERSGRFPWGSGEHPFQRLGGAHGEYMRMKKDGLSDKEIAENLGCSVTQLRARMALFNADKSRHYISKCVELADNGKSNLEIARALGISETSVRNYLKASAGVRREQMFEAMNAIKETIGDHGFVNVGKGTENRMNIAQNKLMYAVSNLEDEGYKVYSNLRVKQGGSGNYTTVKVVATPDMTFADCFKNMQDMKLMNYHSEDGGMTFKKPEPPVNVDSKRIDVRFADDPISGADMDGVIEIRRGVEDLDLGKAHYAQVRIGVDGTHYLKGMAVYADDLPDGIDIRVNSNKNREKGKFGAFKEQKTTTDENGNKVIDQEDPFGASIKNDDQLAVRAMTQRHYIGKDGKEHLSALNIVNEEGSWEDWSRNLPSQFLGKQSPQLAKRQLDIDAASREAQFNDIMSLTNPVLKADLLEDFARNCDSAAVHLKAASMPRQATHVILPVKSLKEDEVYAPNYRDGEQVALVRFPHEGAFQMPILTVNNKNREAGKRITGQARDAVGINPATANILSGADFDGDTVLVIPTKGEIRNMKPLEGLKDFDPKTSYATTPEQRDSGAIPIVKTEGRRNTLMGMASNLITDMTLQGASPDELARATRYSMTVIDSLKHKLDYQQCYKDNRIAELQKTYQTGGASTLLSRAKKEVTVPKRRTVPMVNPETGEKIWKETGEMKRDIKRGPVDPETGKPTWIDKGEKLATSKSTMMAEATDAYTLTSGGSKANPGTKMEGIYAEYANRMKAMGNRARKEALAVPSMEKNPSAAKAYAPEVASLKAKLNESKKNSPVEAKAQAMAQSVVRLKRQENPDMTYGEEKKALDKALKRAREIVGAKRVPIEITDKEWEAIQSGAVAKTTMKDIFRFTDSDELKKRAMPKESPKISAANVALMKSMLSRDYTREEVAKRFGISTTTLSKYISE